MSNEIIKGNIEDVIKSDKEVKKSKELDLKIQQLVDRGCEDTVLFNNYDYASALIGVSESNCAIYDFNLMVEYLMENEGMEELEAIEWIEYNTIRALPYMGDGAPIILYRLEE